MSAFIRLESNFTNFSLTCEADKVLFYYWRRQHGIIPASATGVNTSVLILNTVQLKDAGNYQCVAINGSGRTESEYAILTFKGIFCGTYLICNCNSDDGSRGRSRVS